MGASRHGQILAAVGSLLIAAAPTGGSAAELPGFQCSWPALDYAKEIAGTLFAQGVFIKPSLTAKTEYQTEIEERVLGQPLVSMTKTQIKLEFGQPNLAVSPGKYKLVVWISRINQKSEMILEKWLADVAVPSFTQVWSRPGNCDYTKF